MADVEDDAASARFEPASDEAGDWVLRVSGEVDMSNVALLHKAIDSLLASEPRRLVLDVRDLTFMDSSGLAVLLQIAGQNVEPVVLRHPRSIIRRLVETTGVTSVLQMES